MITQIVSALFNACWQGLALVAVTSLALRFLPRSSASTRYAVWFSALVAVAALPAIDFGIARALVTQPVSVPSPVHYSVVQTGTVTYSHAATRAAVIHPSAGIHSPAIVLPTTTIGYAVEAAPDRLAQAVAFAATIAASVSAVLSRGAMPLFLTWIGFAAVMLYRLGIAYVRLRRVKRGLVPMDDAMVDRLIANSARPVVVGIATDLTMPCVLGFARPAIALPETLAAELTSEDLQRIVRHEHAHVRRWDDVANALQLVVQAVMCLNPAVHLIGRSLNVEREIACDDFAVEPLAERVQYAKCLTHIAVNGFGRGRALPAPGFFFNRKQLLVRVERLLERGHNGSTTIGTAARYALVGLAIVAIAVARVQLPVIAATSSPAHAVTDSSAHSNPVSHTDAIDHVGPIVLQPQIAEQIHVGPEKTHVPTDQTHLRPNHLADQVRHELQLARLAVPAARTMKSTGLDLRRSAKAMIGPSIRGIEQSMTQLKFKQKTFVSLYTNMVASSALGASAARAGSAAAGASGSAVTATARASAAAGAAAAASASGTSVAPAAGPGAAPAPAVAPVAPVAPFMFKTRSSAGDFLDALASAGYKNLSVDDLVRLKNVGVDGELIDAAVRYSGSRPSVETLVRMASVGVDADYLNRLQSSGYPRMSLEDVIRMRSVGVDPEYIRDMNAALHSKPTIEQLTQMRALGVDADFVRSFAKLGYDKLSPNDLMRLRAVGVDAGYVRMLRSKGIGGSGLSVDDLIRMKSVGVE